MRKTTELLFLGLSLIVASLVSEYAFFHLDSEILQISTCISFLWLSAEAIKRSCLLLYDSYFRQKKRE